MKTALALASAVLLSASASAQQNTPEQASAGAGKSFTAIYGNLFPDNFRGGDGSYGATGGVEAEFAVNRKGSSLVAGAVFFDAYKEYKGADGQWKQDRVRSFPLTVGVRQRIGPVVIGAGLNPVVGVTRFTGPTQDPQPYANGRKDYHRNGSAAYVMGGLRVPVVKHVDAGAELRKYFVADPVLGAHNGSQLSLSLTIK